MRHEQGAVHAADGYARASGKVGCCLVTSGPGATNTVTGIATAYCDSIPLVVFTGQVPTQLIGNDAFQEVDIVGITRPCTKHNFLVKDVRNLAKTIRQAFYLARSGRPGPVLVDLPKDIMQARTEFVWPEDIFMRSYNPTYKPNLNQLRRTAEELAKARKPIILAGGGVIMANASEVLCELADLFRVFGDSTRIKILYALHDDELCVQDIANAVQLSQSAVSHQLRVLKDSKLVRFRRDGKTIYYALDDDHVRSILSMGMDHIEE